MNFPQSRKITKMSKSSGANRLVMATTRAATFSAKIRTLSEFHSRILSSQQPSNAEIVTTLRYFQQTLIGFLKDIPSENSALFERFNGEVQRASFFPNLSYSGLFYGIVNLLDAFPHLTSGQTAIGEAILDTLKALYFFLDRDCIDQIPYMLASQLGVLPDELDKKLVRLLCECLLPYSLSNSGDGGLAGASVPSVLMLVLQHSQDSSLHTMLVECLMARRENVYQDLLAVIAKGTSESRIPAANLLFHYWPLMNPTIIHRKSIQYRIQAWSLSLCQNSFCTEKTASIKRCYDPVACARFGDTAPPMALCKTCAYNVESERPMAYICQPIPVTNTTVCQNKGCESSNRMAFGTCFAEDCIRSHNHAPLRLCHECFVSLHSEQPADTHIRHSGATCTWGTPAERDTVEAVVKLLKETSCQLEGGELEGKRPKWLRQLEAGQALGKDFDALSDERRMLSRFGVWMMAALCPSSADAPPQSIGYIMSMLFQWFSTTALLPNDSMGAAIEQLKTEFTLNWLNMAIANHYETFVAILQPDLPDYAQVGGVWEKLCSRKDQLKEGLSKLLSLMPYDVILLDTWNNVIPGWLQALSHEVEEDDLQDIKVLLCKIFEPDMCPLPFEQSQVFHFVSVRLVSGVYEEMLKALDWLHLLSRLNIRVPLVLILEMFAAALRKLHAAPAPNKNEENDLEEGLGPLAAEVVMVDIVAQQVVLNEVHAHEAMPLIIEQIFAICALLLQYSDNALREHTCQNPDTDQFSDCVLCQQSGFLYQVVMHLSERICPSEEIKIGVDMSAKNMSDWLAETQMTDSVTTDALSANATAGVISPQNPTTIALKLSASPSDFPAAANASSSTLPHDVELSCAPAAANIKLAKAMVADVASPATDECVDVLPPSESVETAHALSTTLTETDVGHHETCQVVTSKICDSQKDTPASPQRAKFSPPFVATPSNLTEAAAVVADESNCEFWSTSVGRFRFRIDQLPTELQLVHSLLKNIDREVDPDVHYYLLATLKYLCLHYEALSNARREHRGFLIWTQENCLIPKLWTLLRSDYAHVGERAVPLLIHAITLPCGEEVFWSTVNADFTSEKWEVRFKAVERAYVLAHLIIAGPIRANRLLQTCLSCVFSHLIVSAHDPDMAVAQRTVLALKALPQLSLNLMCLCLESQFDSCILDRPLIIARICLLATVISEANILSWEFFIQRFETLALEAQLKSQMGDSSFVQDLLHTDPMSELYQRKVTKARQSLNEADSVRSIVKSLRDNSLKHQLTIGTRTERVEGPSATAHASSSMTSWLTEAQAQHHRGSWSGSGGGSRPPALGGYSQMREFTDEESNLCLLLNRVVDMENPERHTVYLTVALFVHFLCKQQKVGGGVVGGGGGSVGGVGDEKINAKKQSLLLRHFNALLGYSNSEKCFTIPPNRLRRAAVCNAFLSGLPEILDNNLLIGNQMLPIIVQLLLHLPSPQKFASDFSVADYSLVLLRTLSRHSWLHSLIIILYKYRCDTAPVSETIRKLMLIVIATVENHCHICDEKAVAEAEKRCSADFESWSNESFESDSACGAEGEVIEEEETDAVGTPTQKHHDSQFDTPARLHSRPESLNINTTTTSAAEKQDKSEQKGGGQQKFIQPEIIEPPEARGLSDNLGARPRRRAARKRHRSKNARTPQFGVALHMSTSAACTADGGDVQQANASRLHCSFCGGRMETFDEETLSLSLVALATFLHREPVMAAPILFRVFKAVTRFVDTPQYPWHDNNVFVPGNSRSTAKQLIRVIFHQLSGSGIALQLFDSHIKNVTSFWPTISFALADFNELNPVTLLQYLFEDINENWPTKLARILHNCAAYLPTISADAYLNVWNTVVGMLEVFFRRYHSQLLLEAANNNNASNTNNIGMPTFISSNNNLAAVCNNNNNENADNNNSNNNVAALFQQQQKNSSQTNAPGGGALSGGTRRYSRGLITTELKSAMIIMSAVLRVQNVAQFKSTCALVENYAKWLCEALHHCAVDLRDLLSVCTACNRALIRERDKQCITRAVCAELVQAIKFKCELAERNYMTIVDLILQDFGEDIRESLTTCDAALASDDGAASDDATLYNTGASEAIRPFMSEILDFIADFNVLSKLKKQTNSDRIGGDLKAALSEVVALEMSRPTVRDSRTVMRFIPWLYSPPSLAQAVPGAFLESVTYVRILSWLLLGALHATKVGCLPIPINCSNYMADYIHFVLVGFADQSKQSVVHMSALFYAFHLCQLWTIYCEQTLTISAEDAYSKAVENVLNFWARVTPAILQLLSHSKVLAYMVNLHFVNTMQALQQCNSAVLCQLYPMWQPILTAYHAQIPTQLRVKLDACENQTPLQTPPNARPLDAWLKKVRYKISQIELQTSAASPFYNV